MLWNDYSSPEELSIIMERSITLNADRSYSRKRARSASFSKPAYRRIPRTISSRSPGGRTTVALCGSVNFPLTADVAQAFSFDMTGFYTNGISRTISGLAELVAVYDMMRVAKVEITILPAANSLDYANQTLASGTTNLPIIYHAVDYNDETAPALTEMQSNPTNRVARADKILTRTIYPRLEGSNGVIDVGSNYKNLFMRSNASSTQKWFGFKIYLDMLQQVWTYGQVTCQCKVYYECMQSK